MCDRSLRQSQVFTLRGKNGGTEEGREWLAFDDFGADKVYEEFLDATIDVGRDDTVGGVIVVDRSSCAHGTAKGLPLRFHGLDMDGIDAVGAEHDTIFHRGFGDLAEEIGRASCRERVE